MNQKNNNLKFNNSATTDYNNKSLNPQNQRDRVKLKIMDKYGVSLEDASRILDKLEAKQKIKHTSKNKNFNGIKSSSNFKEDSRFKQHMSNEDVEISNHKHVLDRNNQNINNKFKDFSKTDLTTGTSEINFNKQVSGENQRIRDSNKNQKVHSEKRNNVKYSNRNQIMNLESRTRKKSSKNLNSEKNVDSILEDIIPSYNKEVSIDVNHVDLTFEVQNEKIDTLKESFIRFLRRDKSKKIKIHALKDISFQIYKGEKVGIIGYNGAGKSTLLNVITGIYRPDKGTAITYGKISPLLSLGAGFDPNFSGRKNIILNGAVLGYDKKYLESKMEEIIEFSELGEFIDIPIKNYSSGMLAKLGFSIATTVEPDILIIDEILGVGDVNFQKKSRDKIRSLMDGGTTVLLVSHSIPQIRELCDKAVWIDMGRLREIGDVNKVCDNYIKDSEKASNEQLANIKLIK